MKGVTYSADTMSLKGPVTDYSTREVWCDWICASDDDAVEDALVEVNPEPGDRCAFCGKALAPVKSKESEASNGEK